MKEYIKPDLEVVKIRVEEDFANNTTRYNFGIKSINSTALQLEKAEFEPFVSQ